MVAVALIFWLRRAARPRIRTSRQGYERKTAEHLSWPESRVKAALNYAEAFPREIEDAIVEDRSYDFDKLKRLIPSLELLPVPAPETKAP